jgi:hypothetical protein
LHHLPRLAFKALDQISPRAFDFLLPCRNDALGLFLRQPFKFDKTCLS